MGRLLGLIIAIMFTVSCAGLSRRADLQMPYDDRLQLASIYVQNQQEDRAVALLEEAVTQDGGRPEAFAMLGEIFFVEGDLEESANHFKKALKVGGDDPLLLNNLAWVEMNRGNPDKAFDFIERALNMNPVPVYPYLDTRARIFKALGRYPEAILDAGTALKLVPEYDTEMRGHLEELLKELEGKVQSPEGEY